jgi:hypothetical protein
MPVSAGNEHGEQDHEQADRDAGGHDTAADGNAE